MSDTMALKHFATFEIKDANTGAVEAVIATLNVVDRDEDIIRPGAIPEGAKVSMSEYGHDAVVSGRAPVGKGALFIEGNKAIFKGRLFLATQRGRDTFETLKEMGSDQEWSFGFRVTGAEVPTDEERAQGARRILTKLDCFEVSPVIIGAGVGTQTLGVKHAKPARPVEEINAAADRDRGDDQGGVLAAVREVWTQPGHLRFGADAAGGDLQAVARTSDDSQSPSERATPPLPVVRVGARVRSRRGGSVRARTKSIVDNLVAQRYA
jgi:Caudovirus prohead serine protease